MNHDLPTNNLIHSFCYDLATNHLIHFFPSPTEFSCQVTCKFNALFSFFFFHQSSCVSWQKDMDNHIICWKTQRWLDWLYFYCLFEICLSSMLHNCFDQTWKFHVSNSHHNPSVYVQFFICLTIYNLLLVETKNECIKKGYINYIYNCGNENVVK